MLARIAHELYWLGRNLARAEFTARAVEAVFQAELQGTSDSKPGVSFGSGGLLAMFGDVDESAAEQPRAGAADARRRAPGIDAREHRARPRGGAHGARRDQRRDVGGDQHHRARPARRRPAGLEPRRPGPYLASQYVKERTALIWGVANRSMLRDEAKCFLDAGGLIEISDMVLRMLRVALPAGDSAVGGRPRADPAAGGGRLSRLPARGHLSAERAPGGALPAVRARLPGQRGGVRGLAARGVHGGRRRARATQSRCCA